MTIEYRMGVDWDGDGCVCREARLGDALNRVRTPVTFADMTFTAVGTGGGVGVVSGTLTEPFGLNRRQWTTGTGSANARVNVSGAIPNLITASGLTVGQPYTAAMYVRANSATAAAQPLVLDVRRATDTVIASSGSFTAPLNVWTRVLINFTPDVSAVSLSLRRPTSDASVTFDISGFSMVEGTFTVATLPGFNAGTVLSTYENIVPWVMAARWNVGARDAWVSVADKNVCTLTLKNTERLFSPENGSSPLANSMQDRLIILEAKRTTDTAWTRMYTGYVDSVLPTPGRNGPYTAILEASCSRRYLEGKQVEVDLLVGVKAEDVTQAILDAASVPYNGGVATPTALSGAFTWPYAGDNWADGIEPVRALAEVFSAERGLFYFDRNNFSAAWSRAQRYAPTTAFTHQGTFTDVQESMDYRYGDLLYNRIEVKRYPRRASASTTLLLWTLDDPIVLAPLQSETIRARYTNGDENDTVGGSSVTEATFTSVGAINRVITPKAQYAIIEYTNPNASATRTVLTHTLQGRRIRSKDAITVIRRDTASISTHGERPLRLDLKLVAAQADAREIAVKELARYKDPRGRVASMLLGPRDTTQEGHIVARTVGDRITVVEFQTAHNAGYVICGEEHELTEALRHHKVRWYLEPAIDL